MKADLLSDAETLEGLAEKRVTFPAMRVYYRRHAAHLRRLAEACGNQTALTREEIGLCFEALGRSQALIQADVNLHERLRDAFNRYGLDRMSELGRGRFWGVVGAWATLYPDLAKVEE